MPPRPRSTALLALAAAAFLLSALRFAPVVDDAWDESIESIIGPVYYGRIEQVYQRFGFWELRGAPYLRRLPVSGDVAPAALVNVPYFRHPALTFWLTHLAVEAGGWSERTFRLFPIALSSATAAVLVLLIGGLAGTAWAAAALLLYLVLPMSWFVGVMTGYEPCTLAFMLGAFYAHVRLRHGSRLGYSIVWLLVFVGGLADWIGIGIVPAIWAFEIMTPHGARCGRVRSLLLAVPAGASVAASASLIILWTGGVAAGLDNLVRTAHYATVPVVYDWNAWGWFAQMGRHWRTMFTLPLALLPAVALPRLLARCRSETDGLPRVALALLVPAILNVVLFINHAYIHDYWCYYALPTVLITAVIVLRGLARMRLPVRIGAGAPRLAIAASVLALIVLGANAAHASRNRYVNDRTEVYRARGREFNGFVGRNDVLLFVVDFNRSVFYLESWYVDDLGGATIDSYRGMAKLKRAGVLPFERIVALVPEGSGRDFTEDKIPEWREIGDLRRMDAAQVAADLPALSVFCSGRGLWVLTIE